MDTTQLLPNHVTITEFAEMKRRTRVTVYRYIDAGHIRPDPIGKTGKILMIDWEKYKNVNIPEANITKSRKKKQDENNNDTTQP